MRRFSKKLFIIVFVWCIACGLWISSYAGIPHLINYQGWLTDANGAPLNGSYNLTFRIYDSETAGNLLWEETQTGVVIQKGIFSLLLGSVTNLNLAFDKPYFLEIKVNNEVMSPRQRIASGAYAFRAEHGVPRGVIAMWSGRISDIPSGWVLCDGTNGTPDLRDRFIVGARQDDGGLAKTNVTGSLTQTGDGQIASHSHGVGSISISGGAHIHTQAPYARGYPFGGNFTSVPKASDDNPEGSLDIPSTSSAHTHTLSGNTDSTGSGTRNVAVYYALAFIMKL